MSEWLGLRVIRIGQITIDVGRALTRRLTKRRTKLEKNFPAVFSDLVAGMNHADVARKYGVVRSSVTEFVGRNHEALDSAMREVTDYTRQVAIADKQNRILVRDALRTELLKVKQARANGETGEETGLVVKTYKTIGSGKNTQTVEEWKIDPALVELIERLQHATAEELGQLPRPDQNINVKAMLLVREIGGTDVDVS